MGYKDKEKQRAYQLAWMQKRRQEWIASQGTTCAECKTKDGPWEVDHIDRSTKIDHKVWSWSKVRMAVELEKCQLLCTSCHLEKTVSETYLLRPRAEHGTHSKYSKGCRCVDCKKAHSDLARETRALGKKW